MKENKGIEKVYYTYILECTNDFLYTGVTTDYNRRLNEHKGNDSLKKGAKFTKSHKPIRYVAMWKTTNRSNAQKLEARIKQLDKSEKVLLVSNNKYFKIIFKDILDIHCYKRLHL